MRLRLFRGIAVAHADAVGVMSHIRRRGLAAAEGQWSMTIHHPGDLSVLLAKQDLSREDTRPPGPGGLPAVCACGDEAGAAHYARIQNRTELHTTPVMIEFAADTAHMAVDGKDLLYTVLAAGDPTRARPVIAQLFGSAMLPYVDAAWATEDMGRRIAICDLAVHDPAVVLAHYANQAVIAGRAGTVFRSAFLVRLPVPVEAIKRVWIPDGPPQEARPTIRFENLLRERR